MKRYIVFLLFVASGAMPVTANAQTCAYAPAECPTTRPDPYGSPEDSISRLGNPVIPQEITMENRLREKITAMFSRTARKEGWDFVQISDGAGSGARDANGGVLAYPLRPPHWMIFEFQYIVNKDSLEAWKDWQAEFARRRIDKLNDHTDKLASVQDKIKACMDSANFYADLKGKYMNDHMAQYQKDLMANNKAGTAAFEKGMAVFDKKADAFVQKAAALQKDPGAGQADADFEAERKRQTVHFRDASILIVEVGINMNFAKVVEGSPLPPPGNAAIWMVNHQPDPYVTDLKDKSQHLVLLLRGDWKPSPQGQGYTAGFSDDKTGSKRIKCDQVQTVSVHLSGNAAAMRRWLADGSAADFEGMIVR